MPTATSPTSSDSALDIPLVKLDPWLEPVADKIAERMARHAKAKALIDQTGGLLGDISQGHRYFGLNRGERDGKAGVWYREWAPAATALRLIGDFNGWDYRTHPLVPDKFGVWSLFLPDDQYADKLVHGSKLKVNVIPASGGGSPMDRLPAYIRRVVQDPTTHEYAGQYWNPPTPYVWKNPKPLARKAHEKAGLRIYEGHVGMSSIEEKVSTYVEFTRDILPRIRATGYNAIQLMAIMEHPYYGSFGYHVSNFFSASSRFGTPEELKALIDAAHGMGLKVLLDIVHSHAVKNTHEGLNRFDGSDFQYFHGGPRGEHVAWDSMVFDYSKYEVQRFLLSNVRYWLEEFNFDGFRFDGVTSMLYLDHGLGRGFSSQEDYVGANVDNDAVTYLQLANELAHLVRPEAITIAEDVSGMIGMGRSVEEGGIGFDYRLSMGVPDQWIKLLKHTPDELWSLNLLYDTMLNRKHTEKHVGYAESHDQALVGDKTIAFWLMDKEMYFSMDRVTKNLVVDRGIALHKMIRLMTFALAGEAYLNFMGNEFGHPEWVDFPRVGNGESYHHARRQWNLADDEKLRYGDLLKFDVAMQKLDDQFGLLGDPVMQSLAVHEDTRQLIFFHGPLVFAFNFHATESFVGLRIPVPGDHDYKIVLNTDDRRFGGNGLVDDKVPYKVEQVPMYGRDQTIRIYLPARSAQVLTRA